MLIEMHELNMVLDDLDDEWEDLQDEGRIFEGIPLVGKQNANISLEFQDS